LVDISNNSQSDRAAALTFLRNAAITYVDATFANVGDGPATSHYKPAGKIAHSMATRFKIEHKFTGNLGEDLTEYISNFMDAADDYNLTNKQNMDFAHLLHDGEAKRFYREKICPLVRTSPKTPRMQAEFDCLTRHTRRVRKHLQKLNLMALVDKRNCTVTERLE
jgi:hypothetical protein